MKWAMVKPAIMSWVPLNKKTSFRGVASYTFVHLLCGQALLVQVPLPQHRTRQTKKILRGGACVFITTRNSITQMYCCYFDKKENRVRSQRVTSLLSSLGYLTSPHVLAGVGFCPEMGLIGYRSQALTLLLRRTKLALLGTGPRAMETGESHDLNVPACSLPSTPTP